MRTLLFCTAWADDDAQMESRVGRWLRHHARLPWPCPVEIAVIGDGIPESVRWPDGDYCRVNLFPHLGRASHLDYPGWWRSYGHAATVARDRRCRRIWHVESDFFIASRRMMIKLHEVERGLVLFWCPRHGFPETGIQAIGEDMYPVLNGYQDHCLELAGRHAEHILPRTCVVEEMRGDRYGESATDPLSIPGLDFYGQLGASHDPVYLG